MTLTRSGPVSLSGAAGPCANQVSRTETQATQYLAADLAAAEQELRDALSTLERAALRHAALIRDGLDADADVEEDLDVLLSRCSLLELEAAVGRALVRVRRLRAAR